MARNFRRRRKRLFLATLTWACRGSRDCSGCDLPADADVPSDQSIYEGVLVDAVKSFQRRLGRDPNGRIDAQTLADLNVPLSRRVRQMQLTLERWRTLPDS